MRCQAFIGVAKQIGKRLRDYPSKNFLKFRDSQISNAGMVMVCTSLSHVNEPLSRCFELGFVRRVDIADSDDETHRFLLSGCCIYSTQKA